MPENLSLHELEQRWNRCRTLLKTYIPGAQGLMVFSRLNIYYFSGTFGNGLLWLPLEGYPVLLCRRGRERAQMESPMEHIYPFHSYKDIEVLLRSAGAPLPGAFAVEMNGLSWALGNSFSKYLSGFKHLPGDKVIAMTRGRKTEWELVRLRSAGTSHEKCLMELLPPLLGKGMTELEIAHLISRLFFQEGHHGILRMESYGEEVYLGHISIGESGNYPSVFNGPVGLRGAHPAVPYMGSNDIAWKEGQPLTIDNGFTLEGYHTDKTQVYWLGEQSSIPSTVLAAHNFCIELQEWIAGNLKPGVLPSELWRHSRESADRHGWSEGFMGLGKNKVNFVGHGIGLAIDEYPVLTEGFDLPLEEGMVLAVEPKIGIRDVGIVGVENTYEVTPAGGKCLTGAKFNHGILCIPGNS
jgi:Xaa-Pro aminopeptidase